MYAVIERLQIEPAMRKVEGDTFKRFFAALITRGFEGEAKKEWSKFTEDSKEIPETDQLLKFAKKYAPKLEPKKKAVTKQQSQQFNKVKQEDYKSSNNSESKLCPACKEGHHQLFRCQKFLDSTVPQRWNTIKANRYCSNCLHSSHTASSCTSDRRCKTCNGRHNSLLHRDGEKEKDKGTQLCTSAIINRKHRKVTIGSGFIYTALVSLQNKDKKFTARVAFDSASSHSIMTENMASLLKADRMPVELTMRGTVSEVRLKHAAKITMTTVIPSDTSEEITMAIAPNLPPTSKPADPDRIRKHPLLQGLRLADNEFGGDLDALIGTYDMPLFLQEDQMKFDPIDRLTATSTVFGWVVTGPAPSASDNVTMKVELAESERLDKILHKIYTLEQVPQVSMITPEEQSALDQFEAGIEQGLDGSYTSALPRVSEPPPLGNSRQKAKSRAISNERTMARRNKLQEFKQEMNSYMELDHAEIIPEEEIDKEPHYYLPIQGVIKESSTTTAVRPVFDGSSRTSSGYSFNDCLLPGPCLYPNISDILLHFRMKPIALSADIGKMFRAIKIKHQDRDFHRFFWRNGEDLLECRMKRLTFGIRSSPFVATAVLHHHAKKNSKKYPRASQCLMECFYVDDFLFGAHSKEEAAHLRFSLCKLLSEAGMTLRKWRSNNKEFLKDIPQELVETNDTVETPAEQSVKALGVHWDSNSDSLHITVPQISKEHKVTKRHISSTIGMLYDVLGLISPFIITAKMLLQELWILKYQWDKVIPDNMLVKWKAWTNQLTDINRHPISRCVTNNNLPTVTRELHGFADASNTAYAATVYLVQVHTNGTRSSSLIISRAKVKPARKKSIPQMELEAARLLTQLIKHVSRQLAIDKIQTWTDSSAVLGWLKKMPCHLQTFQANRVAFIQEELSSVTWRYVPTKQNPADLPTRGLTAEDLISSTLWWKGPPWLCQSPQHWPENIQPDNNSSRGIKATVLTTSVQHQQKWNFYQKYSSYHKIIRITAWLFKAIRKFKQERAVNPEHTEMLTSQDLEKAKEFLINLQQQEAYSNIITLLQRGQHIPKSHQLAGVVVKLSDDKAGPKLIITGRVRDQNTQQPRRLIPLSTKSPLTKLFINWHHQKLKHPSTSVAMSTINQDFYIPGLKSQLKKIVRKCPTCRQVNQVTEQQQLGLLPDCRTSPATTAFTHVGIDFAGPLTMKEGSVRKPAKLKVYICIFICMKTKAIHIETCRTMEKEEFMKKFRKFCNIRGTPTEVFTDNGTNFTGTASELAEIQGMVKAAKNDIIDLAAQNNIRWHFTPPRSPHQGGLWEAGVKAAKRQLQKIIAPHPLRQDELECLLTEVAALLNSRPLCTLDGAELEEDLILTPGHFLAGRHLKLPPQSPTTKVKISNLRRWQLVQRLQQDYWSAWTNCYVQSLQSRTRWQNKRENIKVGDIVYVKDETLQSNNSKWPIAKVTRVHPGTDSLVRTVQLQCRGKVYKRGIERLIKLDLEDLQETRQAGAGSTEAQEGTAPGTLKPEQS